MPTSRPFAYNTGSTITGTEQLGSIAIGYPTSGFTSTGLRWWNGPDEDLGYVDVIVYDDFRNKVVDEQIVDNLSNYIFTNFNI